LQQSLEILGIGMWKAALAGAMALAVTGTSFAFAGNITDGSAGHYSLQSRADAGLDIKLARAKAALQLTPEQQRHWPRVESALREIVAKQGRVQEASAGGIVSRTYARASDFVLNTSAMKRLESAARPLLDSLSESQKRVAVRMAHAMGLGKIAARFE
jgi:hypothetical protein